MAGAIERTLEAALTESCRLGQILIRKATEGGFILCHRDDQGRDGMQIFHYAEDAIELAKFDDAANYRSLKTAPDLRHGWQLEVADFAQLRSALDYFYPGRLEVFAAWKSNCLRTTPLRQTLGRQSGMYRVAATILDKQVDELVGRFCRSDGGCLRTILWKRDSAGAIPSTKLPAEKFDPMHDQTGRGQSAIPLLCQEACALVVNECRKVVKTEGAAPSAPE